MERQRNAPSPSGTEMASSTALLTWGIAGVWALIVGLLMAGGAALIDLPGAEVVLVSVLGGFGAAAYIILYAGRS